MVDHVARGRSRVGYDCTVNHVGWLNDYVLVLWGAGEPYVHDADAGEAHNGELGVVAHSSDVGE